MQGIFQKENTDKALKYGIYRHLPTYEKIIRNLVSFYPYTYMLKCSDGTLYTGWTNDLEKRVEAHNSGKGAKYTKARRPVELAYYEEFETKEQAMKREYAIKQLGRKEKQKLIAGKKVKLSDERKEKED